MLGVEVGVEGIQVMLENVVLMQLLQICNVLIDHLVVQPFSWSQGFKVMVIDVSSIRVLHFFFVV